MGPARGAAALLCALGSVAWGQSRASIGLERLAPSWNQPSPRCPLEAPVLVNGGDCVVAPVAAALFRAPNTRSSAWAIAASAVLPGTGQYILGVNRFIPYVGIEAYSWIQYANHAGDFRRERNAYRDLAARAARAMFSVRWPAGDFEYYERMEHFLESGRFDVVAGGTIDPEPDTSTYNGSMWLLARRTFWTNVDVPPDTGSAQWKSAIGFYVKRAYDDPFRWSWRSSLTEHDEFRRLIRRSNESNRKSLHNLGVIIANHVLSTVDAYITVRVRRRSDAPPGDFELVGSVPFARLRWGDDTGSRLPSRLSRGALGIVVTRRPDR